MEINIGDNKKEYKEKNSIDFIRNNLNKNKKKLKISHNYLKKKIIINIKSYLLLIYILILIILSPSQQKTIKKRTLTETNEITIIIRGEGEQTLLSNADIIPN